MVSEQEVVDAVTISIRKIKNQKLNEEYQTKKIQKKTNRKIEKYRIIIRSRFGPTYLTFRHGTPKEIREKFNK